MYFHTETENIHNATDKFPKSLFRVFLIHSKSTIAKPSIVLEFYFSQEFYLPVCYFQLTTTKSTLYSPLLFERLHEFFGYNTNICYGKRCVNGFVKYNKFAN